MSLLGRRLMMTGLEDGEVKEWKELYDSGYIEETILSFETVDVTGCSEIFGIVYCAMNEEASGNRSVQARLTTDENLMDAVVGNNLITTNSNKSCSFFVKKICDSINVESASSANSQNPFGGYFDYNASYYNGSFAAGYEGDLKTISIRSNNEVAGYEFGIGSRCKIYGR